MSDCIQGNSGEPPCGSAAFQSVSAVIPVKGRIDLTRRCVALIRRCFEAGRVDGEVIIVDSDEGSSREWCEANGCRWIDYPTGGSFNYSRALNFGVAAADCEIVLISNNDVVDVGEEFIARVIERFAANPLTGLVSVGFHRERQAIPPTSYVALWFAGWHYCIRKSVWEKVGGACEEMCAYGFDEADTSIRLALAGYVVEILEDVYSHHLQGQTYIASPVSPPSLRTQLKALATSLDTAPERVDEILSHTNDAWAVVGEITEICRKRLSLRARIGTGDQSTYGLRWNGVQLPAQNAHFSYLEADISDLSLLAECVRVVRPGGRIRLSLVMVPKDLLAVLREMKLQAIWLNFCDGFEAELQVAQD